ncbi:MAG: DUF177 domain-containing protein [Bacteroidales bacterium]|nr:DUF177 domain-containing protein [Bacteroidales bacterium]
MKIGNQYIIPLTGLKSGSHSFNFTLDEDFCKSHEAIESDGGAIEAKVALEKKSLLLELSVQFTGSIKIQCDRCLEFFDYPVNYIGSLIVKFKEQESEQNDDIWILNTNETDLDLFQYFYDSIGVMLPIKKVHPEDAEGNDGCIMQMNEQQEENDEEKIDPRWAKLKDLLNEKNK